MNKKFLLNSSFYLAVLVLLMANFIGYPIAGGEEQYLGFTQQWVNPDWVMNSFSFSEFAGTRLVFQWLIYPVVELFGIANGAIILRILTFIALAYPLAEFFKLTKIKLIPGLLALQLFFLLGQNLFGGEWIVKTFEPKAVAYIFVFFGLNSFLKGKYIRTAVFLALSTYFHFLVGGWVLIVLGLIMLWEKKWIFSINALGTFVLLLLPFVIYLYQGYFGPSPVISGHDPDWIYCYYRLPHHLGIFRDYTSFINGPLLGVLLSALVLVLSFTRLFQGSNRKVIFIIRISVIINLVFVMLSWVDGVLLEQKGSFLVKFYPFRTNSLALLLFLILMFSLVYKYLEEGIKVKKLQSFSVITILVMAVFSFLPAYNQAQRDADPTFDEAARNAELVSAPESVFAIIDVPLYDGRLNRFSRLSRRDGLVVYKFTPAEKEKLTEWYDRVYTLVEIEKNAKRINQFSDQYNLSHIMCKRELDENMFELLYGNVDYKIYKLRDEN